MEYIHLRKRMINEGRIMGRLFEKLRNRMKENYGMVIFELTIVFPVIFFVLFFYSLDRK